MLAEAKNKFLTFSFYNIKFMSQARLFWLILTACQPVLGYSILIFTKILKSRS